MVQVSAQLKKQVDARIAQDIAKIKARYGVTLPTPTITYDLRGRTAGQAWCGLNLIKINAVLLVENVDEMLSRTVPHELAHIATAVIYPEAMKRGFASKRRPHGAEWQSIMHALGADASRCHTMDTSNSAVKRTNRAYFQVKCVECSHTYNMGPVKAQRFQANPSSSWCGCVKKQGRKGKLVAVSDVSTPKVNIFINDLKVGTGHVKFSTNESKIDACKRLYKQYASKETRQQILHRFVTQAGCTPAGANTYYNTCQKG
jgi:predicted SprT family Zn-dependent metalloprotease